MSQFEYLKMKKHSDTFQFSNYLLIKLEKWKNGIT